MDFSAGDHETEEYPLDPPPSSDLNQLVHYQKRITPTARISIETMGCVGLEQDAGSCTNVGDAMGIILPQGAKEITGAVRTCAWQSSSCDSFFVRPITVLFIYFADHCALSNCQLKTTD